MSFLYSAVLCKYSIWIICTLKTNFFKKAVNISVHDQDQYYNNKWPFFEKRNTIVTRKLSFLVTLHNIFKRKIILIQAARDTWCIKLHYILCMYFACHMQIVPTLYYKLIFLFFFVSVFILHNFAFKIHELKNFNVFRHFICI